MNNARTIVGLGYKKRSGKDTVGEMLKDEYGFKMLSFAGPLKELCHYLAWHKVGSMPNEMFLRGLHRWADKYGMDTRSGVFQALCINMFDLDKYEVNDGGKVRKLLQYIGTDLVREHYSKTFWIDCVARQMAKAGRYVVTDVRFDNELEMVMVDGHSVRIDRDTGLTDSHKSELELDGAIWDYVIDNNGTLDELCIKVSDLVKGLGLL